MPFVPALIGAGVAAYSAYDAVKPEDGPGLTGDGGAMGKGDYVYDPTVDPQQWDPTMPDPRGRQDGRMGNVHQQRSDAFNYGGDPRMGASEAGYARDQANMWAAQRSPDINYIESARYGNMGDESRGMGMQSRDAQMQAMGLMRDAAMGNAPSRAELMMQQGAAQNAATQMQMAAGARGPAALAMAQQQAAANTSMGNAQNTASAGMMRADEMERARGALGGMTGQMRGMDYQQRQQDLDYQAGASQRAQANAQLGLGYRQMGQAGALGYDSMRNNILTTQGQGRQNYHSVNDNRALGQASNNQQSRANDINTGAQIVQGIGTAVKSTSG
jgi:hypothetical protein